MKPHGLATEKTVPYNAHLSWKCSCLLTKGTNLWSSKKWGNLMVHISLKKKAKGHSTPLWFTRFWKFTLYSVSPQPLGFESPFFFVFTFSLVCRTTGLTEHTL